MTAPGFTAHGKEVLLNGQHYADARDELAADTIATVLNCALAVVRSFPASSSLEGQAA